MKQFFTFRAFLSDAFATQAQGGLSEVEAEIRVLENNECQAMLHCKTDTLQQLWASDYMVNAPFNRITLSSQEVIDLVSKGVIRLSSFTRNIERIMLKKDMAITMGSEEIVPAGQMPKAGQTVTRRYTNIWIKQNGAWRLTARHANEICQ